MGRVKKALNYMDGIDNKPGAFISKAFVPVKFLLKIILVIFSFIIGLYLLFLFVFFIVVAVTGGSAGVFLDYGNVIFSKIPFGIGDLIVAKGVAPLALFVKTGGLSLISSGYGSGEFETTVDKNSINNDLGIKVENFKAFRESYKSGQPITLIGDITATSLKDDAIVTLSCDANGVNGTTNPATITLKKYRTVFDKVECFFPENSLTTDRDIDPKIVNLRAKYDFITEGYMDVWAMDGNALENYFMSYRKNPLNDVNDVNVINKEKGVIKSIYTYGPMKLAVGSDSQPFTNQGPGHSQYYNIIITMSKNYQWKGNFVNIKSITLKLADTFELNDKADTSRDMSKFNVVGNEGRYKIYQLNQDDIDNKLNNMCEDLGIIDILSFGSIGKSAQVEECLRRLEQGFPPIFTEIKVVNLEGPELKKYSGPVVYVEYQFETSEKAFVTLRKK
ncbi:hypothetical protein J4214_03085 [Candidatus Woesearchaeota archaeon]|nr:hypothetical protein [Candidatus Woesearchaeota archaeon]